MSDETVLNAIRPDGELTKFRDAMLQQATTLRDRMRIRMAFRWKRQEMQDLLDELTPEVSQTGFIDWDNIDTDKLKEIFEILMQFIEFIFGLFGGFGAAARVAVVLFLSLCAPWLAAFGGGA